MPLEIVIDTKKKYGVTRNLQNLVKIDSLVQSLRSRPYIGKRLRLPQRLNFGKQAFFEGDSTLYIMPGENDMLALRPYRSQNSDSNTANASGKGFTKLVSSFMDKDRQEARISVTMKDVGSEQLPFILDSIERRAQEIFKRDSITALTASAEEKGLNKDDSLWGKRKFDI